MGNQRKAAAFAKRRRYRVNREARNGLPLLSQRKRKRPEMIRTLRLLGRDSGCELTTKR